jgi:hypothetical protein
VSQLEILQTSSSNGIRVDEKPRNHGKENGVQYLKLKYDSIPTGPVELTQDAADAANVRDQNIGLTVELRIKDLAAVA